MPGSLNNLLANKLNVVHNKCVVTMLETDDSAQPLYIVGQVLIIEYFS